MAISANTYTKLFPTDAQYHSVVPALRTAGLYCPCLQMARKHIFVTKKIESNCQLIDIENLPKSFKTSSLTHLKVANSDILIDVVKN